MNEKYFLNLYKLLQHLLGLGHIKSMIYKRSEMASFVKLWRIIKVSNKIMVTLNDIEAPGYKGNHLH